MSVTIDELWLTTLTLSILTAVLCWLRTGWNVTCKLLSALRKLGGRHVVRCRNWRMGKPYEGRIISMSCLTVSLFCTRIGVMAGEFISEKLFHRFVKRHFLQHKGCRMICVVLDVSR